MKERMRTRQREFTDTAKIMEPGGEGFIIDPILRIKLGTQPILKDFKVRSYLNFMASLPMKRNPTTGYFEFAETAEEITAFCKAYFWAAEPPALADSGYDKFRINKARHLLVQPILNTEFDGTGYNRYTPANFYGVPRNEITGSVNHMSIFWNNQAVAANEVSPATQFTLYNTLPTHQGVQITVNAPTTIIIQTTHDPIYGWCNHTEIEFTEAGSKAQDIMSSGVYFRLVSTQACTITALLIAKG